MSKLELLRQYIQHLGLTESDAMDLLQTKSRTISDNCIELNDVAEADAEPAMLWLRQHAK